MRTLLLVTAIAGLGLNGFGGIGDDPFAYIPEEAPRTWILEGHGEAFIEFSQTGEGRRYFERIRNDLDNYWMEWPMPAEPDTYGDPEPKRRTREQVDLWRGMQNLTGRLTGIAEAATLVWLVTGEERYLEKAKSLLLGATQWDPLGSTGVDYNDEAHFRLMRKLPEIYDQIRDYLSEEERQQVVDHLRIRGNRSFEWIMIDNNVTDVVRNSIEVSPKSHPVRFMAMTGQAAVALWDDLPETRDWWRAVYTFYRDVFTPWGGDDGGWAEGVAYWRGIYEHAVYQDLLLSFGDPLAYHQPFWKNTAYFQVYFVKPYRTTSFGDLSNAGQFNMEPGVKHFVDHLSKVTGNGAFRSWASHYSDKRTLPHEKGIQQLSRTYPTATEIWVRDYIASRLPLPDPQPLEALPGSRYFEDIGWVSMHSNLAKDKEDIMLSFKSSPYASFSHSHADQNAFIINAYGEQLAINSGYREYHRSQMHRYYTRQTVSKNNILIKRRGQEVQSKAATGKIIRFEESDRAIWTTGDATVAFNTLQDPYMPLLQVTRDVVFVDKRYFIVRDHVRFIDEKDDQEPGRIDWLLHAREPIAFDESQGSFTLSRNGVHLLGSLQAVNNQLEFQSWTGFPIEPDPKYKDPAFISTQSWLFEPAVDQAHFQANTVNDKAEQIIFAVLWPTRDAADQDRLKATLEDRKTLLVERPDGRVDKVTLSDDCLEIR